MQRRAQRAGQRVAVEAAALGDDRDRRAAGGSRVCERRAQRVLRQHRRQGLLFQDLHGLQRGGRSGTIVEPIELLPDPAELDHRLCRLGVARRGHRMLPASSKIGKYISTTIRPITRPMAVIMTGSIRRVATSTKRDSSSS